MAGRAKRGRPGGWVSLRSTGGGQTSPHVPFRPSPQPRLQESFLGYSDDSTQPPDGWAEQMGGFDRANAHEDDRSEAPLGRCYRRRGKAKGTEFAKLRKLGRVQVSIPSGARGPSAENALVLAARVTYIVRTFANMKHKCWTLVPEEDKDELYTRVIGDFTLDWDRYEDRECIKAKLASSYKTYRYDLHNIYKKYSTKAGALANPPKEMREETWKIMCEQWGEEEYQKLCKTNSDNRRKLKVPHTSGSKSLQNMFAEKTESKENLIEFYKRSHTRRLDGKLINEVVEATYEEMMRLFALRDPEKVDLEVAKQVFHEVMGHKPGHVRGLGNSAILKPSPTSRSSHVTYLTEQVEQYKSEIVACNEKYDELWGHMQSLMAHVESFDEKMDKLVGSQMSTQGDQGMSQHLDP